MIILILMIDAAHVKHIDEGADVFEELALSVVEVGVHICLLAAHIEETDDEVLEETQVGRFDAECRA